PNYLVMEYIEGPTLAQRIKQGAFTMDAALPILRQMADAVEAAHDKNITHRDLKPDNIKVTPEGVVKVLDFGLAKAADPLPRSDDPANATTLRLATVVGAIMGTPEYMAPEQASGEVADKRADIWAFGVVALEMFTARKLFDGATIVLTMAEVLSKEFTVDAAPPAMQALLKRCLVRDVKNRMRDIGEARIALAKIADGDVEAATTTVTKRRWLFPALATFSTLGMVSIGIHDWLATRPVRQQFLKLETNLGAPAPMDSLHATLAISPDGSRVVFVGAAKGGGKVLFSRRLDQDKAAEMPGTDDATYPFFSPDGRWVGFFDSSSLKKAAVDGGAPITLCDAAAGRGASWGEDGNIIASFGNSLGLSMVSANGGKPVALTEIKETAEASHRFPSLLPGGRGVLFSGASMDAVGGNVEVYSFKDRKRRVVAKGSYPRFLMSGHVAYINSSTLFAVPFDLDRLEAKGAAFPLVENVAFREGRAHALYDVSRNGTLVYYNSSSVGLEGAILQWVDAAGRGDPLPGVAGASRSRLSPDGKKVAYLITQSGRTSAWVYDLQRGGKTRLTTNQDALDFSWTPDSRAMIFSSGNRAYWTRADGASQPQQILEDKGQLWINDISANGQLLSISRSTTRLSHATLEYKDASSRDSAPRVGKMGTCCEETGTVFGGRFSPDGKWIAYLVLEPAGPPQVYVRSVPDNGAKWQVSAGEGGASPIWSPNGRELFFKQPTGRIMVVDYSVKGGVFTPGTPRSWTEHRVPGVTTVPNMSIAPDGKRMLVLTPRAGQSESAPQAVIIINLFEEVRRRAQANGQ
ncbi:MAG: protein kinase, partial [Candidatus Solibacter usitatus]|nr:protein kinase [Candidatus Solibacter usitatus]